MEGNIARELKALSLAASELVREGWARSSSGNISLRSGPDRTAQPVAIYPLYKSLVGGPMVSGTLFWVSRTGCTMDQISKDPEGNLGMYRSGHSSMALLRGTGPPSTEYAAHLLVLSGTDNDACIHCHWDDIMEISSLAMEGDVPDGIGVAPDLPPGSIGLAEGTLREANGHRVVIWPYHGIFAAGRDPGDCLAKLRWARNIFKGPDMS